jgi:hypothetical protein
MVIYGIHGCGARAAGRASPRNGRSSPAGAISQHDRNAQAAFANTNATMTIKHHLARERVTVPSAREYDAPRHRAERGVLLIWPGTLRGDIGYGRAFETNGLLAGHDRLVGLRARTHRRLDAPRRQSRPNSKRWPRVCSEPGSTSWSKILRKCPGPPADSWSGRLPPAGAAAAGAAPAPAAVVAGHGEQDEEDDAGDEEDPGRQDQKVRVNHAGLRRVLTPGGGPGAGHVRCGAASGSSPPHRPPDSHAARMVAVWSQPRSPLRPGLPGDGRTGSADVP